MNDCLAELHIADDFGDNYATMKCQREQGHEDEHQEEFERDKTPVIVTWEVDER